MTENQTFQEKMQKFNQVIERSSLFPNTKEILYYQSGNQNDIFSEIAIFQAAVEFIKKEYQSNANECLDQDDVKYSVLFKFLNYLDKPFTKEKTYKQHLIQKSIERVQQNQEDMNQLPLVISPLYMIDRQHSNDTLILEKERELLTNDDIKKQYEEIQKQEKESEEQLKKIEGKDYIEPCANFYREKAIMTIYYYFLQQQTAKELHLEEDNSLVGLLSKYVQCYPRETVQFQSNYTQMVRLFKLLPSKAKKELAEQLQLFNEKENYNEEKIIEKLDKLKEGENTEFLEKVQALI